LDELSCAGENVVSGFGSLADTQGALSASDGNLPTCNFDALVGGDVTENLATMRLLLSGSEDGVSTGLRNSVLLNAGAALWIARQADDLPSGVAKARDLLSSGAVAEWLERARQFYN